MPYKHESKKIPKCRDRRRNLSDQDKADILDMKEQVSIHKLAKQYDVSRRTIQFIWYPERHKRNLDLRAERGGSKEYYDKDKHRDYMRDHRRYKQRLYKSGELEDRDG